MRAKLQSTNNNYTEVIKSLWSHHIEFKKRADKTHRTQKDEKLVSEKNR